jgi:hypothetical protein
MANVYVYSGAAGAGTGADWTNAYTTLAAAFAGGAAGDRFLLANDHAESQASALTLTPPGTAANPCQVICVNRAGSVPPVSADLATTATITTTGTNAITLAGGYCYWYGITFNNATGSAAAPMAILSAAGAYVMQSCQLLHNSTSGSSTFAIGSTGGSEQRLELIDTTLGFSHVSQTITLRCVRFIWSDTATPIKSGGAFVVPTNLFALGTRSGTARLEGLDLSTLGSGKNIVGANATAAEFYLSDCKIDSAVTVATTPAAIGAAETYVTRTDSSGTNYIASKYSYAGTLTTETTIIRTGGASNGTGFSHKIVTTANCKWAQPFESIPLAAWNATVGSSVTVTVEGIWDAAALPNDDEVWFDVEGLATVGSPLGSAATGSKADILASGTALTASTQAWDSLVTARANTTAYTLGQTLKVATNTGRVFFCTTAGTSAGSEPAGYAAAVDGGSVTDGTAVFRAGVRFKKAVSITPQIAGAIYATPRAGKASATFYLDPKITLS